MKNFLLVVGCLFLVASVLICIVFAAVRDKERFDKMKEDAAEVQSLREDNRLLRIKCDGTWRMEQAE